VKSKGKSQSQYKLPLLTFRFEVNTSVACPQKSQEFQKNLCPIFVFLVPHTHDDVGWLITVRKEKIERRREEILCNVL